jgi:AAA+ superfamily predicted ATPase
MTSREESPRSTLLAEQRDRQQEALISALSEDQQRAVDWLESLDNTLVANIYGPSGTGKTFLGWALARSYDEWSYHPWPPTSPVDATKIVIDNVAPNRDAFGRVRETVTFDDADLAVALSREPLPDLHDRDRVSLGSDG